MLDAYFEDIIWEPEEVSLPIWRFTRCKHQHESGFLEGDIKSVTEDVKGCSMRALWRNYLCAHSGLWLIKWEKPILRELLDYASNLQSDEDIQYVQREIQDIWHFIRYLDGLVRASYKEMLLWEPKQPFPETHKWEKALVLIKQLKAIIVHLYGRYKVLSASENEREEIDQLVDSVQRQVETLLKGIISLIEMIQETELYESAMESLIPSASQPQSLKK